MTRRYKIIDDGLYDITDWTDFDKALEIEFGFDPNPVKYEYKPDLKNPVYKLLRVTK